MAYISPVRRGQKGRYAIVGPFMVEKISAKLSPGTGARVPYGFPPLLIA